MKVRVPASIANLGPGFDVLAMAIDLWLEVKAEPADGPEWKFEGAIPRAGNPFSDVAMKGWMALGESVARAGVRKLVMITSHGGNTAAMTLVAQDLRAQLKLFVVTTTWMRFGTPDGLFDADELRHGIHGGGGETSIMLARFSEHVRQDKLADFRPSSVAMEAKYRWLSTQRPAPFAWQVQDLHPSGASGDTTQASAEKGERLLDHGARAFIELLAEVDKFDLKTLTASPRK